MSVAWELASCAGLAREGVDFHPEGPPAERRWHTRLLQQVCEHCPIRIACLAYGREKGEGMGVWGGVDLGEDMTSDVHGVAWRGGAWVVRVKTDYGTRSGGSFADKEVAEQVATRIRKELMAV